MVSIGKRIGGRGWFGFVGNCTYSYVVTDLSITMANIIITIRGRLFFPFFIFPCGLVWVFELRI